MYHVLINQFCRSCLDKHVNSENTVEDVLKMALSAGENNHNLAGGYMMLQAVLATLESEGGCQSCIRKIKDTINLLENM